MNFSRREAIRLSAFGSVAIATGTLSGCTVTKADVINYANDVVTVADQIASVIQPAYTDLASKIDEIAANLSTVIAAYDRGVDTVNSVLSAVSEAATIIGTVTGNTAITTAVTVALAACAVAYNTIKTLVGTNTAIVANANAKMTTLATRWDAKERKACPHRVGRSTQGDIRAAWNKVVKDYPELNLRTL